MGTCEKTPFNSAIWIPGLSQWPGNCFLILAWGYAFLDFRETGREKEERREWERERRKSEREIREKYQSVASVSHPSGGGTHNLGSALIGNKTQDSSVHGMMSQPKSHNGLCWEHSCFDKNMNNHFFKKLTALFEWRGGNVLREKKVISHPHLKIGNHIANFGPRRYK